MKGEFKFFLLVLIILVLIPLAESDGRCERDNDNKNIAPSNGAFGRSRVCASDGKECTRDCSCRSNGLGYIYIFKTDCIASASMSDVYFDDKGELEINNEKISDDNCDEAGEVDGLQDEELKSTLQEDSSAFITITNYNKFGSGASDAIFTINYGQPDDLQELCIGNLPCNSICDGLTTLLGDRIACNFELSSAQPRKWIEGEISSGNCCGDDIFKDEVEPAIIPLDQMLNPITGVQPDNPDLSTEFCTGCPVPIGVAPPASRVWAGDDENVALGLGWNKCCGDDAEGISTSANGNLGFGDTWEHSKETKGGKLGWDFAWQNINYDSPDMSQTACNSCKIGTINAENPSIRSWDPALAGPQRCCGNDFEFKIRLMSACDDHSTIGEEYVADNPDNSEIHCVGAGAQPACPSTGAGDAGPGGRAWLATAQEDPRNFPADSACSPEGTAFAVNCNLFGGTPDWGISLTEYENSMFAKKIGCGSPMETVGCCGDDSEEKWCTGFDNDAGDTACVTVNGAPGIFRPTVAAAGTTPSAIATYDIDDITADPEGFACDKCVVRKRSSITKPAMWWPDVAGPMITPCTSDGDLCITVTSLWVPEQHCCGDDPLTDNWCKEDDISCLTGEGEDPSFSEDPDGDVRSCIGCDDYGPTLRDWEDSSREKAQCCGDDYDTDKTGVPKEGDAGVVEIKSPDCLLNPAEDLICGNFESKWGDEKIWTWENAGKQDGNILHAACSGWDKENEDGWDVLSYGEQWAICGDMGFMGGWSVISGEGASSGEAEVDVMERLPLLLEQEGLIDLPMLRDTGEEGNDYLCVNGPGEKTIYECCGSGSCSSDGTAGVQKFLGEVVYMDLSNVPWDAGKTQYYGQQLQSGWYYCTSNGDWSRDLDVYDEESCLAAQTPEGKNAKFVWTGKYCCGELDDVPEHYNDFGSKVGACWNSSTKFNGEAITKNEETDLGDVIVDGGVFHGCAVDKSNFNPGNDYFVNITDTHNKSDRVIRNHKYCDNINFKYLGKLWCSFREEWRWQDYFPARPNLSITPWYNESEQRAECCPANRCWVGNYTTEYIADGRLEIRDGCIQDMYSYTGTEYVYIASDSNPYRCINGTWDNATLKTSPFGLYGYCPKNDMCLRDPGGRASQNGNTSFKAKPVCLYGGQYMENEDWYCANGDWYSRTALIAEQLLKISAEDLTLACGNQQEMLNYIDYLSQDNIPMKDYLSNANNACILSHDGKIAFGISLKKPVSSSYLSFLKAIGKSETYCDNVLDDGNFNICTQGEVYYNRNLNSMIYLPDQASFSSGIFGSFLSEISSMDAIIPSVPSSYGNYGLFGKIRFFNSIFIKKHGLVFIAGVAEAPMSGDSVMGVSYSGISTDLCSTASKYPENAKLFCTRQGQKIYILNNRESTITSVFPDLTYKLRTT
ncbi:hypothetical protein HY638_00300 [Candidatus Woesearchaeota archaeon]|nr:hypothetical protein [Candidatus Woesearchaeota archaeon]